jgi:hypothetical protein
MPLRAEFETEYYNDAEEIISPLTFDEDDTPDEIEAKYRLLELYNRKLALRYARRKFVIERQLMYVKKLQAREKDLARDERDTYGRLRIFMQVLSRTDFDTFVDGVLGERRIRRRIEQMQRWRQAGCRTVNAGERFAEDVKRRTADGVRKRAENDQAATQMIAARSSTQARRARQVVLQGAKGAQECAAARARAARRTAAHHARGGALRRHAHLSEAVSAHQGHVVASQSAARTARAATHEAARVARRLTRHAGVSILRDGWMVAQSQINCCTTQTRSIATNRRSNSCKQQRPLTQLQLRLQLQQQLLQQNLKQLRSSNDNNCEIGTRRQNECCTTALLRCWWRQWKRMSHQAKSKICSLGIAICFICYFGFIGLATTVQTRLERAMTKVKVFERCFFI